MKKWLGGLIASLLLCMIWSGYLYWSVPVAQLRDSVEYHYVMPQRLGLGMEGLSTLSQMPDHLIFLIIASEDHAFAEHSGYSLASIYRKLKDYYVHGAPTLKGGSTITQQLAKNLFTDGSRSFYRKYKELLYAIKIERHFTKEEILTLYANHVQTGANIFGINAAARTYFNKATEELSWMESAFIVGLFPSPVRFSQWFLRREYDPYFMPRLRYKLAYALRMDYSISPYRHLTNTEKKYFFSQQLSSPRNRLCLTKETQVMLDKKAQAMITEFVMPRIYKDK